MKDDSNKPKTINEQSELNLSFYFGFEESSSTESQNQKQLKAVPLYTANEHEHSQDERPCALLQSVEFEYLEEPVELVASSYSGCDCKGCQSYKIELENAYEKIAAGSVSNEPFEPLQAASKPDDIEAFESGDDEPLQAPETLLVRAKRQLKNSVKAAIKEPYLFSLNLVRFVIIPLIVATMVALFGKYGIGESQDKFVSGTYTFFFFITVLAGFVLNLEFYKKIKLYQNDEPLNYVDVRYRQGTYLIAHLYTLIVMVVASEIHLMPSAFLLSLIVCSAIALFAFYDESDNKF
ncbi:hypothetical protein [Pseudomonas sp.]|uniref:hypothetical protein n=1 Tax=Pseudomonas sp. TaxID=306 RepID=UPI0025845EDF|nr:hypothetical protein [Pseudomonas sp.]